jgi:transcriptional regulator of arginine metabolism
MKRAERLVLIEKLIMENIVSSQEELLRMMLGKGAECTQATLSRDLRQLGISKGFEAGGGYRYLLPGSRRMVNEISPGETVAAITSMTWAQGVLLVKTPPGFASAVAINIDRAGRYEIAGTIAGDDTILVIPRDNISRDAIEECFEIIFQTDKQKNNT